MDSDKIMSLRSENSPDQNDLVSCKDINQHETDKNLETSDILRIKETIPIIKMPDKELKDANVLDSGKNHTNKDPTFLIYKDRSEMIKDENSKLDNDLEEHNTTCHVNALSNSPEDRLSMEDLNNFAVSEISNDKAEVEPETEKPKPPFLSDTFAEISNSTVQPILENSLPYPVVMPVPNLVEENKSEDPPPTLEIKSEPESTNKDETVLPCDNNNAIVEPSTSVEAHEPSASVEAHEPSASVEVQEPSASEEVQEPSTRVEAHEPSASEEVQELPASVAVQQTTTDYKDTKQNDNISNKSVCDVVKVTNIIDNVNVSDMNKNGEAVIGEVSEKESNHKSNDSLFAQELDESGDLMNITESSSDDLLDDSTFLPSESLLFTPQKFDRFDEETDDSCGMNLRLSPFSRTAPSTPQPQPEHNSGCPASRSQPGLISSEHNSCGRSQQQPLQTTASSRPRIYSDTTGGLHRLRSQGTSSFLNSGPSSVPLLDRITSTGVDREGHIHSSESRLGEGGHDSSWQQGAANTGADSDAPLSLPAALSAAGSKSYDYLLKVLLVGDSDVGKQEIITGMEDGSLDSPFTTSTGGAAYKTTTILIDGKKVKLHIWDTSGQGRFCTIIRSYSRGAQGILLVYDITNRWSFEGIDRWVREVEEHAPGIPKVLVGNRLHLAFKRQVDPLEAEAYAQKHNMGFYEISPLVNFNITESFQELCRMALKRNGMERLWRGNRVLALHEMCCHAIVANTNVYGIDKLPLPEGVKANLKSYAMTSYPYHRHTFKSWKERKKKLRKEENAAKITNCVNATRKSCTIS